MLSSAPWLPACRLLHRLALHCVTPSSCHSHLPLVSPPQVALRLLPNLQLLAVPLRMEDAEPRTRRFHRPKPSREAAMQLQDLAAAAGSPVTVDTSGTGWLSAPFTARRSMY